jgi:hypothetical protein
VWESDHLALGGAVFSDGASSFGVVIETGCIHHPTAMAGLKPRDVPESRWINTVLGNLKTSLSGCYYAFDVQKYSARYLVAFGYQLTAASICAGSTSAC